MQCSECLSGENFNTTRVNGGNQRTDSQSVEIQTSVVPSETWPRDDLEEVHALLFRFLGTASGS